MRTVNFFKKYCLLLLLAFLTGCGGGGSEGGAGVDDQVDSLLVLNGQVADGYLVAARVFLDRNGNRMLDNNEPWTESGDQGHFSLQVEQGEGSIYPVVAEIIAGQTFDEDLPHQYVNESYRLETPVGRWSFISPLTTLIKNELDKEPSLQVVDAETRIRSQMGLDEGISLFEDYLVEQENLGMLSAHHAARIIARLMGSLQTEIERNVGIDNAQSKRAAISLMISDQVMDNAGVIARDHTAAVDAVTAEKIKTEIMARINTTRLNAETLDRYLERMNIAAPVWDMMPPRVLNQHPPAEDTAPIDVVVSLTLDEEIDEASFSPDSIRISGPNGPIEGMITYDPTLKKVNFTPDSYLMAFTVYQVEIQGISDDYGNLIDPSLSWSFTTIFDQLPPVLPDF